jgi:hypothetical protein
MATSGTPNNGLDEIARRVYVNGASFTLVAYTNAADSLSAATVTADLTQPTSSNGYAPITLSGTWSTSGGVVTYTHPGNPTWSATGSWSGVVRGVAIVSGAIVMHFKDLDTAFTAANGKKLAVDLSQVIG